MVVIFVWKTMGNRSSGRLLKKNIFYSNSYSVPRFKRKLDISGSLLQCHECEAGDSRSTREWTWCQGQLGYKSCFVLIEISLIHDAKKNMLVNTSWCANYVGMVGGLEILGLHEIIYHVISMLIPLVRNCTLVQSLLPLVTSAYPSRLNWDASQRWTIFSQTS